MSSFSDVYKNQVKQQQIQRESFYTFSFSYAYNDWKHADFQVCQDWSLPCPDQSIVFLSSSFAQWGSLVILVYSLCSPRFAPIHCSPSSLGHCMTECAKHAGENNVAQAIVSLRLELCCICAPDLCFGLPCVYIMVLVFPHSGWVLTLISLFLVYHVCTLVEYLHLCLVCIQVLFSWSLLVPGVWVC